MLTNKGRSEEFPLVSHRPPTGRHLRAGDEEQKPGHFTVLRIVAIDTKKF